MSVPPLPKIQVPLYTVKLPSTGQECKYHAFTGKEEKILLTAQESNDYDQIINAIHQVLSNCVIGVDIDSLAVFDIEYLLLRIRAVSVNNVFKFTIVDPETEEKIDLEVDVDDIKVHFPEGHTNKIRLDDKTMLVMKYPGWRALQNRPEDKDFATLYLINSLKEIHVDDVVYDASLYTEEQLLEFFDQMTADQLLKVEQFFQTMPSLSHTLTYKLKDGTEKKHVLQGLQDFFF